MKIPPNNKWSSNSQSDIFGSLHTSFNLDLTSNKGATRVSPRTVITTDDITNLGVAVGFVKFNCSQNGFYTVAGDRVFNTNGVNPSLAFAASTGTNATHSSDTSDIIHFKAANRIVASQDADRIDYWDTGAGNWQQATDVDMVGGSVHMMCEYANRLYVTTVTQDNFKRIYSCDTSFTMATSSTNTFSLGAYDANNIGLSFRDIREVSDGIWIFTGSQQYGQPAKIFKWNGTTADDPDTSYFIDSSAVMCAIIINDVPYIITAEAELLVYNGGGFVRVPNGRLPVNPNKYLKNTFSAVNDRWIHPRGICITDEGKINILINNEYEDGTIEERLPSGIWEFDLNNTSLGWYHIASLSLYTNHVTDYGQNRVSRVGGLAYVKVPGYVGKYLIGAQLYSDASSTKEVILTTNTIDNIQKYGYFTTPWIFSNEIKDMWQKICARFRKFRLATDAIIIKYRTTDNDATEATITWTSTTTFTTTTDVSDMVGYEVEVVQGKGSGKCSHIVSVTEDAGTYTVTVDEIYDGCTSGTAKARFQNWIKAGKYSAQTEQYREFKIDRSDTRIQIKVCMQFTGKDELYDLNLINNNYQPAK